MTAAKRVIFLDRDGTINVDHGYVHQLSDWEFADRASDALRMLAQSGFALAVVTNQAGVADGRFSEDDVRRLHAFMEEELRQRGAALEAVVFCPHGRDAGCECRKPASGLALQVETMIGPIDYAGSWTVGDKPSDAEFGRRLGTKTALIRSRYWTGEAGSARADLVVDSLFEFARRVTRPETSFDRTHWRNEKILPVAQIAAVAGCLRREGKRLVTANGSFDLLHAGHLDLLEEARSLGDVLFVGVNDDAAVAAAKGPGRPFVPEEARAALLAALICVDYVVIMPGAYAEEPMQSLLRTVHPHIHVNGADYGAPSSWLEWPVMRELGIKGHVAPKRNDFSTSAIVAGNRPT